MTGAHFKFDEIGYWSELKLEIIEKYGSAYTTAFKNTNLKKYYIDGFSGAGVHRSKRTGNPIEGSPTRALKVSPPFDRYYFIDLDEGKTDYLRSICGDRSDVVIHTGDCNDYLRKELLPTIQYKKFNRALCLLDPYKMQLDWEVMLQAGQSRAVDLFLNFPVMDMNRNAIWRNPDKVPQGGLDRMTKFWGDESWKQAAYAESRQSRLFGDSEMVKQGNEEIVTAFRKRLKKVAGFGFVAEPLPMRNSTNAVVYYLFLASPKSVAEKIINGIFSKYR
ncbi:MAG: three-Cys-motif partner protein TcmP [Candidatus Binatus sp.]|uniref:three-Cys-motif partner protein TcmP n=1 Tax=Candidatus Binatus sp. TaxID=2811406 RepID=UPI003C7081EE